MPEEKGIRSAVQYKLLFWSFCSLFFFLPVATSPAVISGMIALCIWIFSGIFLRDRHTWRGQDWFKPVLLLIVLPWMGLIWTEDISTGLIFAKKSYYWLYAFAMLSICPVARQRTLINSFLAGLSVTATISIFQYAGLVSMPKGYPAGFMGHIVYSLLLVFGMLLLSFYYRGAILKKNYIAILGLIALYIFSLSVNVGRIGYVAFVILSPWLLYNLLGRKHVMVFAASVCALVVMLSLSPTVQHRTGEALEELKAYYHDDKNTSIGRRPFMWQGALKMFLENPLIGVGTGDYRKEMRKYKDDPNFPDFNHPHNSFLYMASSYGLVGLSIFAWLLIVFFKRGWRTRHTITGFAALSFGVVLLIGSLTDTQIMAFTTGNILTLLVGMRTGD